MQFTEFAGFRLELHQLREVKDFAEARGISFSEAVRLLLDIGLEKMGHEQN